MGVVVDFIRHHSPQHKLVHWIHYVFKEGYNKSKYTLQPPR